MKFAIRLIAASMGVAVVLSAQTYDLTGDWNEGANPNGVWSFREGNNLLGYLPAWGNMSSGSMTQGAYANAIGGAGHVPSVLKTIASYAAFDTLPGDILIHSRDNASGGGNGEGSIRWTAPSAGVIGISGAAWMPRDIGRSVTWSILVNGVSVTSGTVYSGDPFSRSNPYSLSVGSGGHSPVTNLAVVAGSTVVFRVVTSQAGANGDFVAVDMKVTYGPTDAATVPVGLGCGGGPVAPLLWTSLPILATTSTFSLGHGAPLAVGDLYVSSIPAAPLAIGGGCHVYLDLPSAFPLLPIVTDPSGTWVFALNLPNLPGLSGAQVAVQGVLYGTAGPLGVDLTNGVNLTIGY